jgi:diguanylate cyclase (GGDEF)-like protein/PAS domain S-box-containing protein
LRPVSAFSRYVLFTLVSFVMVVIAFAMYVYAEKQVDRVNSLRITSFQLADELRQSSEDLTRMVRSYVQTGDPIYKAHFQEVLDIRNGEAYRPVDYQGIYWDLVLTDNKRPRPLSNQKIPLLQLMSEQGFTPEEFAKLAEAKANSDALTQIEFKAMDMIESASPVTDEIRAQAALMLHDQTYYQAKAGIMQPIDAFNEMMDKRTYAAVASALKSAKMFRWVFIAFGLLLLWLLWRTYNALRHTLGAAVDDLHEHIIRLGRGDIATPIPVPEGMSGSVMDWLSETQMNLAKIDAEEKAAKKHNERLTQLYAALSQCNQSIVRCTSQAELFPQICKVAVVYGGAKLAWIGLLDAHNQEIFPMASYGESTAYLNNIYISTDPNDPSGNGPTGTAVREDKPFWCQDYQNDPVTAPWRERAAIYGWGSSATLPLHLKGKVIGAFTLYSSEVGAFDEQARQLLEEMATDIDFALDRFEIETERELYRENLQHNEESSRLMLENSLDAVVNMNIEGVVTEWSGAAERIFGYRRHEAMGKLLGDLIVPEIHREAHAKGMRRLLTTGQSQIIGKLIEIVALRRDGVEFPVELSIAQIKRGGEVFFSAFIRDISERKTSEARIQYLANYDALTGLPNRNQLSERVRYAISIAQRSHEKIALMFLDIDHFKDVNDSLGHSVGDLLLLELANRFKSTLREEDTISRLGGDEFILMLPNSDEYAATHVAQKLLQAIEHPMRIESHQLSVTASIGIAMFPDDGTELETLLRNADVAMYKVKQENRNGYRFYTATMQTQSARNLLLVNALRQSIQLNQLEVYYQPQINVADNRIVGVEALLRWHHPELGMVSPSEFIPLAEASGLILNIGEWVLRQAVRQAKRWLQAGFPPMIMAVNLSVVQFRDPGLPNLVARTLEEEDLPPEYLELELTEGVALDDPQGAITFMDALHERGVRMSIDDFGTGYSSLSHLKKFKVYKLKIDQSFVRDISTDEEDKAIVIAIINLARSLGLKTIAEGVETAGQLAFLQQQHCDEVQGYLFSKPLPVDELEAFLYKQT